MSGDRLKASHSKKHALAIPLGYHAHLAGIYRLSVQLAKRGVTITFLCSSEDIERMKEYDEVQGLDFNMVSCYTSYQPLRVFKDVVDLVQKSCDNFQPILEELKSKQKAGLPGPTCIISDRFCSLWARDAAKELNIPYCMFFSCGAISARLYQQMPKLFSDGTLATTKDGKLSEFDGYVTIPGLPPLLYTDFTQAAKEDPRVKIRMGQIMASAEGVIANTFYELEYPQIDEFRRQLSEHSTGRISKLFLIGPISNAGTFKDLSFLPGSNSRGGDSLQWLDSQPSQSVLYICLGTISVWNARQVYELALGLEASEQRFLWVLRTGSNLPSLERVLPTGFEERTKERGLIVTGWVPQLLILAHPSVGGFLTHCGWNSLIESVSFGVPLIGWPQAAEQHLNCRHFVEVLNVAVQVCHGTYPGSLIGRYEFEKSVRLLMLEEEGKAMRTRAQELMLKAKAAVADGGASHRALDEIVDFIPGDISV